jgi:aminoglycoside phosphotransferase (APT) family kinase protein
MPENGASPQPPPIAGPPAAALRWSAGILGCEPVVLRGLRDGGSPWLLQAGDRRVVLRTGGPGQQRQLATEAAGLARAAGLAVPVPELLGHDDGRAAGGVPVVLSAALPGSSRIPPEPVPARLRALGAAAAVLHALPCRPSAVLPRRDHPIGDEDFAGMRAGHDVGPLQREAQVVLDAATRARAAQPGAESVFVHGDLWAGNTLWDGDTLTGLLDWDAAGAGAPGIDLGSLRMDAALCYGADTGAADEVIAGWEAAAGRRAGDVAYWDVVAALATPPGLGWFPESIAVQGGRPDLTRELVVRRHAGFLSRALDRLRP